MRLDVAQRKVGEVEQEWVNNLLEFLDQNEEDWHKDDYRKGLPEMSMCNSLPLRHSYQCAIQPDSEHEMAMMHMEQILDIKNRVLFDKYEELTRPFTERIKEIYPHSTELSYFLSRLKAHGKILGHTDNALFGFGCHRIHIPLKTDPKVEYVIADEICNDIDEGRNLACEGKCEKTSYFWDVGGVYEFSQDRWHEVINGSDEPRIHLIYNAYNYTDEFWEEYKKMDNKNKIKTSNELVRYYKNDTNGIDIV